jgi:hypothetical protein
MKLCRLSIACWLALLCTTANLGRAAEPNSSAGSAAKAIPVRGLHLTAPGKNDLPAALAFVGEVLPKEGVNTLILEFDYSFDFRSRPEFNDPRALGKDEARQLAAVCKEYGIDLIPQVNCLGHQSWAKRNGRLLEKHPEFDETPGKYPENKDIYCRSYCPLHPDVHKVLFDLINELASACNATSFHVGMDEIFILADPDCPRCGGKTSAEVLATEVKTLHDHLQTIHCRMWMWGDRFLDSKATKLGKWEASENATQSAIDSVPKDIVMCDWHYDAAPPTAEFFAQKGFDVVLCPWRKPAVALDQLRHIREIRTGSDRVAAAHALGLVQTTWCGFTRFEAAYRALSGTAEPPKNSAAESAACFQKLFSAMRAAP